MDRPVRTSHNDQAHLLTELVTSAASTWSGTLRLCLICVAISLPTIAILLLSVLLR